MADQSSPQPQSRYDQERQTVVGGQHNAGRDIYLNISPDPSNQLVRIILIAFCISTILSVAGYFIGLKLDHWLLALPFSLFVGWLLTLYYLHIQKQADQRRKEQERSHWRTMSLPELEGTLRRIRWRHLRLIKDSDDGIPLTKQQREEWRDYQQDIDSLLTLIHDQGGTPQPSKFDAIDPPKPPSLSRLFLRIRATLSYLLALVLFATATYAGTNVPRATAAAVIRFIHLLPLPTPTLTPEPTMTIVPTTTGIPTLSLTLTATVIPTELPPATVTPTVVRVLMPTETITPAPILTSTLSADPIVVATIISAPSPSTTITSPLSIEPRTRLEPPTLTPVESTATPTPTPTPTVALGALSGYIAYPVFNGAEYDTVVRDLTTNTIVYRVSRARQPDFRGGGYLLVNREGGGLLRVDINRRDERPVTERDEDARAHWAPGDDRIVFESFEQDKSATILKLQVNSALQSNPPYLHSPTGGTIRGRSAIFLGDGRIAFNGCAASWDTAASGDCGIWSINTDGSGILRLSDQPRDYPTDNFGSQILFTSDRNSNWDVYITNAPLQERPLTTDPARDGLATVSPDGNYIAFVSDYGGQWAIWIMQADGSGRRPLITEDVAFGTGDRDWTSEKISWGQ